MKRTNILLAGISILFLIAGCGGGGGGGNTPTVQMPDNPPMQNDDGETMTPPPDETMTPPDETTTPPPDETPTPPPDETTTPPPDETMTPPPDETTTPPDETMTPPPDETTIPPDVITIPPDETTTPPGENDNPQMDDMTTPIETRPINEIDSLEFRRNPVLSLANPLPAYERGFFGQGVTVMVRDSGFSQTHEDLESRWVLDDYGLSGQENRFNRGTHGTNSAGIVGAVRGNGKGSHGIAPSVRIIPLSNRGSNLPIILSLMVSLDIPISSHSYGRVLTMYPYSDITVITENETFIRGARGWNDILGDHEHVMVWAAGNGGQNTPPVQFQNVWGHYPLIEKELEDNFLIVVALHRGNTIDNHSDGCGVGKMWCIGAIGDGNLAPSGSFHRMLDNDYNEAENTSAAAPVVAGALAVLKSAADMLVPQMSAMTTVRLILLETATPLYADASKNGVRIMENGEPVLSSVYGWGAVNIGAGITHLQGIANQMSSIKQMQIARLGGAAKLANGNKFAPANGENAFRFWGGIETENAWTGIATQEYSGVSGFAEYGKANMRINSFLTNGEIRGAESQSWTAGIQFGDLIRHNDNLRFSAREESRISDGELILQYSFGKQIRIPIKQKPQTIYTAGYSQKTENSKWSAAAEWNAATNAKGVSFAVEFALH